MLEVQECESAELTAQLSSTFDPVQLAALSVEDLIELYDLLASIFCGPSGYFRPGEQCLNLLGTDDNCKFERLRVWFCNHSSQHLDFDSYFVKSGILKTHRHMKRFTKGARIVMKKRAVRAISDSDESADNEARSDTAVFCTKELIYLALEFHKKNIALRSENENEHNYEKTCNENCNGDQEFLTKIIGTKYPDDMTQKKKKKRKLNTTADISPYLYYDEEEKNTSKLQLKPLLILDLNKVLVWRRKKSNFFIIRPYATEFVTEMSKRFTLAIWTSTMMYNAKKIVKDIFIDNNIPLLFTWYNDKCTEYSREKFNLKYPHFNNDEIMKNEDNDEFGNSYSDSQNKPILEDISHPMDESKISLDGVSSLPQSLPSSLSPTLALVESIPSAEVAHILSSLPSFDQSLSCHKYIVEVKVEVKVEVEVKDVSLFNQCSFSSTFPTTSSPPASSSSSSTSSLFPSSSFSSSFSPCHENRSNLRIQSQSEHRKEPGLYCESETFSICSNNPIPNPIKNPINNPISSNCDVEKYIENVSNILVGRGFRTLQRKDKDVKKTVLVKQLSQVWSQFTNYSELNTIIMDDSAEKCVENNDYNCIHPFPYENPQKDDFNTTENRSSFQSEEDKDEEKEKVIDIDKESDKNKDTDKEKDKDEEKDMDKDNKKKDDEKDKSMKDKKKEEEENMISKEEEEDEEEIITEDNELKQNGKLWNYLVLLSNKMKNNENKINIDVIENNNTNSFCSDINHKSISNIIGEIGRYDY